jgi:hypothetical protein
MGKRLVSFLLLGVILAGIAEGAVTPGSLLEAGHFKRLRAWAEPRVAANANDVQAAYYLASAREALGDLNGALPLAEKALASDGNDARYHLLIADICIEEAQKAGVFKGNGLAHRFRDEASKAASLDVKSAEARESLMEFISTLPVSPEETRRRLGNWRTRSEELMRLGDCWRRPAWKGKQKLREARGVFTKSAGGRSSRHEGVVGSSIILRFRF